MKQSDILIKKFFEIKSLVQTDIESFNHFIEHDLNKIIEENKYIEPTIIPHNIDDFKIRLDKIWIQKPEITEADGSKRPIYPIEARLRKVSYSAPVFIKVSAHINDVQREEFETQVGNIPVMLQSSFCHLNGMNREDLIKHGEDPDDPGGYFIINGTEKVLIDVEDLAPNRFMVSAEPTGVSKFVGKLFSSSGSFRIPHTVEKMKDSIFYLTFTRVKRIPLVVIIKALGMTNDADIMSNISKTKHYDEVMINLYEFIDIKTPEDAVDWIAKKIGITQSKEIRLERMNEIIDRYLLPHIGMETDDRLAKAQNLCKVLKKFIMVSNEEIPTDDKDHYMNKRIKLSGDMMGELFRVNLKVLIGDLLYNFQRIVKRGKFPSIKVIIRDKLLTSRIYSSMATGNWVGGRKGISQRIQRHNFLDTVSHLQRVVSPLSTSQENFEARELHPTHLGRLCPIETPEGTNIGLRKNLALLSSISNDADNEKLTRSLQEMGLKVPE